MFVSMWMTKDVLTAAPTTPLSDIAKTMSARRIRRMPIVDANGRLVGLVSSHNVLNTNASVATGKTPDAAARATAADIMTCDPLTTTPETPVEEVARLMCDRKVGALPVLRGDALVGLITESDVFRAFTRLFDPGTQGVRITFDNSGGTDVFPLVAELTHQHRLRVMSFVSLHKHERPLCVVQVTGAPAGIDAMLDAIWKSHHQVVSVIHLDQTAESLKS